MTDRHDDRHDIVDVLVRYATGIDSRDWDLFRTCFVDAVDADYGDAGSWGSIAELTEFMVASHAGMGHTLHRLTNHAISVDGDAASARTYVDAVLMAEDGQSGLNPIGFYDDELVRTEEGWRISRRRFTMVHFQALG